MRWARRCTVQVHISLGFIFSSKEFKINDPEWGEYAVPKAHKKNLWWFKESEERRQEIEDKRKEFYSEKGVWHNGRKVQIVSQGTGAPVAAGGV